MLWWWSGSLGRSRGRPSGELETWTCGEMHEGVVGCNEGKGMVPRVRTSETLRREGEAGVMGGCV